MYLHYAYRYNNYMHYKRTKHQPKADAIITDFLKPFRVIPGNRQYLYLKYRIYM